MLPDVLPDEELDDRLEEPDELDALLEDPLELVDEGRAEVVPVEGLGPDECRSYSVSYALFSTGFFRTS